jgi:hypothetical protein
MGNYLLELVKFKQLKWNARTKWLQLESINAPICIKKPKRLSKNLIEDFDWLDRKKERIIRVIDWEPHFCTKIRSPKR